MKYYQPLPITELEALSVKLQRAYPGKNVHALSFITLFQRLIAKTDADKLTGALIFEAEYLLKTNEGYLYNSQPRLAVIIEKELTQPDNLIQEDERLIYMMKFYELVERHLTNEDLIDLHWKNKAELLNDIAVALRRVKERDSKRLDYIINATPRLSALSKNMENLLVQYEKEKQNSNVLTDYIFSKKQERYSALKVIRFVNETCKLVYPASENDLTANIEKNNSYMVACIVRAAANLFVLLGIKNEYQDWFSWIFLSPERSKMFKECLHAINVKSISEISREKRTAWLDALSVYIRTIIELWSATPSIEAEWKKIKDSDKWMMSLEELTQLSEKIRALNYEEEKKFNAPSNVEVVTKHGLTAAVALTITQPTVESAVLSFVTGATGPFGVAICFVGGIFAMTQIGRYVMMNLMPKAAGYAYAAILDRVSTAVTKKAVEVTGLNFPFSRSGYKTLLGHPNLSLQDKKFIEELVNTMLKFPSSVLSDVEKDQIRNVLGIDEDVDAEFELVNDNDNELYASFAVVPRPSN